MTYIDPEARKIPITSKEIAGEKTRHLGRPVGRPIENNALDVQIGGGHYKDFPIQPAEFCEVNGIGFLPGCIIKRICRWEAKDGIKDLEKAKHEIDLMIAIRKKHGRLPS